MRYIYSILLSKTLSSKDKKALAALGKITKEMGASGRSNKEVMASAVKAQREVRREKKKNRRR